MGNKSVEFDVNITVKDMYNFNVYHNYHNIGGIAGLIVGIIALVIAVLSFGQFNISYVLMMGFFGIFFTIITPVNIFLKSAQQVKMTPMFTKPISYVLSDDGITIKQEDVENKLEWQDVYKVKATNQSLVVYITTVRAFIFPFRDLQDKRSEAVEVIRQNVEARKIKLKEKN